MDYRGTYSELFYRFLDKTVSMDELKEILYHDNELKNIINNEDWLFFLEYDYTTIYHEDLTEKIAMLFLKLNNRSYSLEKIKRTLDGFINDEINLWNLCTVLVSYRKNGYLWIPTIFEGLLSEIDSLPNPDYYHLWDPKRLARKIDETKDVLSHYEADAKEAAYDLLKAGYTE